MFAHRHAGGCYWSAVIVKYSQRLAKPGITNWNLFFFNGGRCCHRISQRGCTK